MGVWKLLPEYLPSLAGRETVFANDWGKPSCSDSFIPVPRSSPVFRTNMEVLPKPPISATSLRLPKPPAARAGFKMFWLAVVVMPSCPALFFPAARTWPFLVRSRL